MITISPRQRPRAVRPVAARSRLRAIGAVAVTLLLVLAATAQSRSGQPTALTNAEFWELFTTMSEPGGSFVSENFVSNETSFQDVIPTLQQSLTPGGVYLGVGPEQNYTYIANLKPKMAVIFDIRRQNAMQHLMYKALFDLSPTRAEFVSRLFSRPQVAQLGAGIPVVDLFDSATVAVPSDSAFTANHEAIVRQLTEKRGFALSPEDLASIEHVYTTFYQAGPDINYGYRPGRPVFRTTYPTFGMLQAATNADSVQMAFLATEDHYRVVRDMHAKNLIIPIVGDFGGPKAIRAVGEYLRKQRLIVTAFYLSNVEQYLFRSADAPERFYNSVASLPLDNSSTFIRSVPRTGFGPSIVFSGAGGRGVAAGGIGPGAIVRIMIRDSAGTRVTTIVQDSAGVQVPFVIRDSAGRMVVTSTDSTRAAALRRDTLLTYTLGTLGVPRDSLLRRDSVPLAFSMVNPRSQSLPSGRVMVGGSLTSGLVSIRQTLDSVFAGRVQSYQDVIAMTKTSGWK